MSSRPLDTSHESWMQYEAVVKQMGGEGRLLAALELSEAVRILRLEGLRARFPEAGDDELIRRLVKEEYGIELPEHR